MIFTALDLIACAIVAVVHRLAKATAAASERYLRQRGVDTSTK